MNQLILSSLQSKALETGEVLRLVGLTFISLTVPKGYLHLCTVRVDGVMVEGVRQV